MIPLLSWYYYCCWYYFTSPSAFCCSRRGAAFAFAFMFDLSCCFSYWCYCGDFFAFACSCWCYCGGVFAFVFAFVFAVAFACSCLCYCGDVFAVAFACSFACSCWCYCGDVFVFAFGFITCAQVKGVAGTVRSRNLRPQTNWPLRISSIDEKSRQKVHPKNSPYNLSFV
jgi:hypothetical protein